MAPNTLLGQRETPPSLERMMQEQTHSFLQTLDLEEMKPAEPTVRRPTRMPGFTCLPTCDPDDGRFLAIASDFVTLSEPDLELQMVVPAGTVTFTIGIFDGDAGEIQPSTGERRWDSGNTAVPFAYSLLTDPNGDGSGATTVELLPGQASVASALLPNDDWVNFTIATTPDAQAPSGNYFYRLRIENLGGATPVVNAFKVRTDGQTLISPTAQPFSYIANFGPSLNDVQTIYPAFPAAAPTTYDGSFLFYFEVPQALDELEIFEGDFDRGDFDGISNQDTDDPNTPNAPFIPPFATIDTVPEGVAMGFGTSTGDPPDENDASGNGIFLVRPPAVRFDLLLPNGDIFANENPSGNQEWERFVVSTISAAEDFMTGTIPPGIYTLAINGVDMQNLNALRLQNRVICVDDMGTPCGPILRLYLVGDTVFADANGNGSQDFGEPGIEGVQVNLVGPGGSVLNVATTDMSGNYSFEVDGGTYEVAVDPSNFVPGGALEGLVSTTGNSITDTVVDDNVLTYDFGYKGTASIGDFVFYDDNGNGLQDDGSGSGLEGVEVMLTEAGADGMLGTPDDLVIGTQTTNDAGFYEFTELLAGLYRADVDETTLPAGLVLTTANEPLDVTLATGDAFEDADFGYVGALLGSIGDRVWQDDNGDGFQDAGEPGLNGVTVTLEGDIDGDGIAEVVRSTVTSTVAGVDGFYNFGDLPAADCEAGGPVSSPESLTRGEIASRAPTVDCAYVVRVDISTLPVDANQPTFDYDGIDTPNEATLTLAEGENNDEVDFGYDVACLTIDFDDFYKGEIIDNELAGLGIHVSTSSASHPAMIFDSSAPTGGDFDLGTPNQTFGGPGIGNGGEAGQAGENAVALGNVLILSEDGDANDPDDNGSGGTIFFSFDDPVLIDSVGVVDIDEYTSCTLEAYDGGGNLIGGAVAQRLGNNSVQTLDLGVDGVRTLKVRFTGSGAISQLVVCPGGESPNGDCEPGDVKDSFDSGDFTGNIGTKDWVGPWIEDDVAGPGPATGNVWVDDGFMFLKDAPDTGTEPSVAREVDLSGADVATLVFKFDTFAGVDADDAVTVEVSDDGGVTWTVLEVITGITGTVTETHTHDISGQISANTQVRFRVSNKYGGSSEAFCLQWVKVLWSCEAAEGGGSNGHPGDHYNGHLAATGESQWQPDGSYYYAAAGSHAGVLEGAAGADFDLYLYRWNGSDWQAVASATTNSSNETVSYSGSDGYYIWSVSSYSGSGDYDLWLDTP